MEQGKLPPSLPEGQLDAVIVSGLYTVKAHEQLSRSIQAPILVYGTFDMEGAAYHSIGPDLDDGLQLSIRRLAALGHRTFGLIHYRPGSYYAEKVEQAYLNAIARAGLQNVGIATMRPISAPLNEESLRLIEKRPTAMILGSMLHSYHFLEACRERNIRIPEDMSVFALGGTPQDNLIPFSRLSSSNFSLGLMQALKLLFGEGPKPPLRILYRLSLKEEASIGPAP